LARGSNGALHHHVKGVSVRYRKDRGLWRVALEVKGVT
jgi:hypothetical protein